MSDAPQVWHHGLVARWWAEFNTEGPEIDYFQSLVERHGQPALDVGCGTGRLLLPFLRAGLDVDGCDISRDMLSHCRERAAAEGLEPRLYQQAGHQLDLPRRYASIVVCGGFRLGGSRAHDLEALRRFHRHLEPGGALLLDNYLPYLDVEEWRYWLPEASASCLYPGQRAGDARLPPTARSSSCAVACWRWIPSNSSPRQIRALLWRGGQLVEQEEHTLLERLYFKNELLDMLALAGFREVGVYDGYSGAYATPESRIVV